MVLLDWAPPDHLGIGRKRGNSCRRKHPAAILALGWSYAPTVAARTRIVSAAGIRLDHRKSVRPFKGIFCDDIFVIVCRPCDQKVIRDRNQPDDQAMTLAAIDRLVHRSTIFEMNVESYRRRAALDHKRGPGRPPTHPTIKERAD